MERAARALLVHSKVGTLITIVHPGTALRTALEPGASRQRKHQQGDRKQAKYLHAVILSGQKGGGSWKCNSSLRNPNRALISR